MGGVVAPVSILIEDLVLESVGQPVTWLENAGEINGRRSKSKSSLTTLCVYVLFDRINALATPFSSRLWGNAQRVDIL